MSQKRAQIAASKNTHLLLVRGRYRDRHRNGGATPPQRNNFRPYRNRAAVYPLIETRLRRRAITNVNLVNIDFEWRIVSVVEKGGSVQPYPISKQWLASINDYLDHERTWNQVQDFTGVDKGKTPPFGSARAYSLWKNPAMWRRCNGSWGTRTLDFLCSLPE